MSTLQTVFAVTAAVAVGTAYVLIRRKLKADHDTLAMNEACY